MGNESPIGAPTTAIDLENTNQAIIEETHFHSMNPMHRYTNYQTSMSIKTISSLKSSSTPAHQVKKNLQNSPPQQIKVTVKSKKVVLLEPNNQKQGHQNQKSSLRSLSRTKTNKSIKSVAFLKQNFTTQSFDSHELSFKSLVINFQNFVDLKQQKIDEHYELKEVLGQGAYGQVFRAICRKTGQERAIKKIKIRCMKQEKRKQFLSELSLLSKLTHPSIIVVYDVFLNENKYYVVMEYCKGGAIIDMLHLCKNKSESTISHIIKQLLSALSYMHSQNIVHRDIKLDNIVFLHPVLTQNSQDQYIPIKIIDFGTAVAYEGKELSNYPVAGTLSYLAPEVMRGVLTTKSDIWSVGVLLVILLTGKSPFKGIHQSVTKNNINNKQLKYNQPPFSNLSRQAKDLISLMLERNHYKRITAAQALNHSWFTNKNKLRNSLKSQNLQQLFKYHKGNNLISVIQSYISLKRITQEQRERLGQIFSAIDTDGNGTIDIKQLVQIYNQNVDSNYTPEEITQMIKSIDKDKSGKIDFNQFIVVMQGRKNLFITQFLADAFDYYDDDKTGYLDRQEITEILKGGDITEINKIIKQLDKDGDKRISKEEFISYFKNY